MPNQIDVKTKNMEASKQRLYCIVDTCQNTSISTPEKTFIQVPKDYNRRLKWLEALGMTLKTNVDNGDGNSPKSTIYVCEDHFNLENDMENYWRWRIQGGRKRMKTTAIPSIQKRPKNEDKENIPCNFQMPLKLKPTSTKTVATTVKFPYRSKAIQCDLTFHEDDKFKNIIYQSQPNTVAKTKQDMTNIEPTLFSEESESITTTEDEYKPSILSSSEYSIGLAEEETHEQMKRMSLQVNLYFTRIKSVLYLGLGKENYFIIKMLEENIHIYVLKKIRTDRTFSELGDDFGMSDSNAARIFAKTLPLIYEKLKNLIRTMDRERVLMLLPIPFRARYSKVHFIIDCFEIKIQKPGNPIKQALTWSEYKKANTIKYLIASTPDGIINFISRGYGGRATDALIVENCGFLNILIEGTAVMADRGFKNIEYLLMQYKAFLIRPPSVSKEEKPTKEQVLETTRIAGLRIHVERVIRRLREFKKLVPHSCLNLNLVSSLDTIVTVVCALINLQEALIKNAFD